MNMMQPNNQMGQFNSPYAPPAQPGYQSQSDILAKLLADMNTSKPQQRPRDDLTSRLEQLELKNAKMKQKLKKDKEQSQMQKMPSSMAQNPYQNQMPFMPPQFMNPNKGEEEEYNHEKSKKQKKNDKKRKQKAKKEKERRKEKKRRRRDREKIRKENPEISFSSSDDSDLQTSSDDSALDDEERNKREINKLIKNADNDISHKHGRDLEMLKDKMKKDGHFKDDLFNQLGLPKYDKDEKVEFEFPDDDEEFKKLEEDRENKIAKRAKHNEFIDLANKERDGGKVQNITGIRRWRPIARSVYEFIHLLHMLRGKEVGKRKDQIDNFKDSLSIYLDVAKGWLVKCSKVPFTSILQDQKMSMDFISATSTSTVDSCFRRAKVRTEAVIDNLIKSANSTNLPYSLLLFLKELTTEKTYIPNNFLTLFEIHRVVLNKYGALQVPTYQVKQLLIAFFLLGKILCGAILMKPKDIGVGVTITKSCEINFKIIASIIWQATLKYLKTYVKCIDPENDIEFTVKKGKNYPKKPTDIISEELYDERDLMHILQRERKWFGLIAVK
jgi:hypothetical protein